MTNMEQELSLFSEKQSLTELKTDKDFDTLFTKIAEEYKPENFSALEEKVKELCNDNTIVNEKLAAWGKKLSLDRNRLKEIFS